MNRDSNHCNKLTIQQYIIIVSANSTEQQIRLYGVTSLDRIIKYIEKKYHPLSVILYGSYANGTNDSSSDFDALVISSDHEQFHDTSFVDNIRLDVFVYPSTFFEGDYACEDFIQISDGRIIIDRNDIGRALQAKVQAYLQSRPPKTSAEIQADVDWCVKMLERAKRCDCEGMFRRHWVLIDSLEIFCDIMQYPYQGPKKSLSWMEKTHCAAFVLYKRALSSFSMDCLEEWIAYIKNAACGIAAEA